MTNKIILYRSADSLSYIGAESISANIVPRGSVEDPTGAVAETIYSLSTGDDDLKRSASSELERASTISTRLSIFAAAPARPSVYSADNMFASDLADKNCAVVTAAALAWASSARVISALSCTYNSAPLTHANSMNSGTVKAMMIAFTLTAHPPPAYAADRP